MAHLNVDKMANFVFKNIVENVVGKGENVGHLNVILRNTNHVISPKLNWMSANIFKFDQYLTFAWHLVYN